MMIFLGAVLWYGALAVDVGSPPAAAVQGHSVSVEVAATGSSVVQKYMRRERTVVNVTANTTDGADLYRLTLLDGVQKDVTNEAIVTHVCSKDWAPGALALAASLRAAGTSRNLVLMVTDDIGHRFRHLFSSVFDKVYIEEPITPHESITRDGGDCVTLQLRAWQLPYRKVLYMDADIIALKTHDSLLDSYGELTAKRDPGLKEQFNGGMFILEPADSKFQKLRKLLTGSTTFGNVGGIQQFLNFAFPSCTKTAVVGCWKSALEDTYNKFTRDVTEADLRAERLASLHYSGNWGADKKPWMSGCRDTSDSVTRRSELVSTLVKMWMDAFHRVSPPESLKDLLHVDCPLES
mmetsp:Transcript_12156/g.22946  ORF Transcript_12156/g.22946 Transcript_12156/m.22946 type:complete len:350 (+) Transcript_12156:87-1136(+)